MGLTPNGPENDKGERLVTSENGENGSLNSEDIRRKAEELFNID